MTKLISVVIATYNAAPHIRVTLDSIAKLSLSDRQKLEVLVIDGASEDNTVEIVREYGDAISRIVSERDDGIYDAMNKGAALASGTWIHFLNAGDRFKGPNALKRLVVLLESRHHSNELWAVSGAVNMSGRRGPVPIPNLPHTWWKHALGVQPHCHQACWFRADVFRAIGGYTLKFGIADDFDLIFRFGMLQRPLELSEELIEYQGGGISEKRREEIPFLLHQVRSRRLGFGGFLAYMDKRLAASIGLINGVRITGGRLKQTFTS